MAIYMKFRDNVGDWFEDELGNLHPFGELKAAFVKIAKVLTNNVVREGKLGDEDAEECEKKNKINVGITTNDS
jgi:hypothetical protein